MRSSAFLWRLAGALSFFLATLATFPALAVTYPYTGGPVRIDEQTISVATIDVAGFAGTPDAVRLRIGGTNCRTGAASNGIDYPFANNLQIVLESPRGTQVELFAFVGGSGSDFCQVLFSDAATRWIRTAVVGDAPFTGSWQPDAPLSVLNGQDPNGTWQLVVFNQSQSHSGSIKAFSLELLTAADLAVTHVASVPGAVTAGQTVTFTSTLTNLGPREADATTLTNTLGPGLALISATASAGTLATTTGRATVSLASVPVGAVVTLTVRAVSTAVAGNVTSTASVTSDSPDPSVANNTASIARAAVPAPALAVSATGVPSLSVWATVVLALFVAGLGARRRRG